MKSKNNKGLIKVILSERNEDSIHNIDFFENYFNEDCGKYLRYLVSSKTVDNLDTLYNMAYDMGCSTGYVLRLMYEKNPENVKNRLISEIKYDYIDGMIYLNKGDIQNMLKPDWLSSVLFDGGEFYEMYDTDYLELDEFLTEKERKILVDEDMPFDVPLEERRPVPSLRKTIQNLRKDQDMTFDVPLEERRPSSLRKTLDKLRENDERRTTAVAEGKLKKRERATKPQMEERRLMSAEDPPKKRGPKPGSKNQPKAPPLEAKPEALSPAEDKDTPSTSHGLLDIPTDFGGGKSLNEALKRQTSEEIQASKPKPGRPIGSTNKEKTQEEMEAEFFKLRGADAFFRGGNLFKPEGFNVPAMARSASSEMIEDPGELERFSSAEGPSIV